MWLFINLTIPIFMKIKCSTLFFCGLGFSTGASAGSSHSQNLFHRWPHFRQVNHLKPFWPPLGLLRSAAGWRHIFGSSSGFWPLFTNLTGGRGAPTTPLPNQSLPLAKKCTNPLTEQARLARVATAINYGDEVADFANNSRMWCQGWAKKGHLRENVFVSFCCSLWKTGSSGSG